MKLNVKCSLYCWCSFHRAPASTSDWEGSVIECFPGLHHTGCRTYRKDRLLWTAMWMPMITPHGLPVVSLNHSSFFLLLFFSFFFVLQLFCLHIAVRDPLINKLGCKRWFFFCLQMRRNSQALWPLPVWSASTAGCIGSDKKLLTGLLDNSDLRPKWPCNS